MTRPHTPWLLPVAVLLQLVMYPILNLNHHTQDLHWYLRGLEEVIIRALDDTSGLQGQRVQGMTGVWVDGHKLAAIGVRARKWVTYHGLALNVTTGAAWGCTGRGEGGKVHEG